MSKEILPKSLLLLIEQFERMPGIGRKSAQKLAFYVLNLSANAVGEFSKTILDAHKTVVSCKICKNLTENEICSVCADDLRDKSIVCVVEDSRYLSAFERTGEYNGVYHVLNGVISPMDNIGPDDINLKELLGRVTSCVISEVIVATNPTTDGEATAMYIAKILQPFKIKVTRLAYGIPVGSDLEYADEVTLFRALEGRQEI